VLVLESDTTVPPAGAVLLSVTVQVVVAPEFKLLGLQASELTVGEATRLITTVFETPPRVAVSVALRLFAIVPAVAANVVEVDPAATVTKAETIRSVLLLDSDTAVPAAGAGLFRVTVQVVASLLLKLVGVQASELSNTGASKLTLAVCDVPFRVAANVAV
jgi:hypothetical protein